MESSAPDPRTVVTRVLKVVLLGAVGAAVPGPAGAFAGAIAAEGFDSLLRFLDAEQKQAADEALADVRERLASLEGIAAGQVELLTERLLQLPLNQVQIFDSDPETAAAGVADDLGVPGTAPVLATVIEAIQADPYLSRRLLDGLRVAREADGLLSIPARKVLPGESFTEFLRADYGVVGYRPRRDDLRDLVHWCDSEAPIGIRLYTGAGGVGKTRLAIEACKLLDGDGWKAGFLSAGHPEALSGLDVLLRAPRLLIVIDYAETRTDVVEAVLAAVRRRHEIAPDAGGQVRVVLLARTAGDWWQRMHGAGEGVGGLVGMAQQMAVAALVLTTDEREDHFRAATEKFAAVVPGAGPVVAAPLLDDDHFGRVLYVQMAAMAAVLGRTITDANDLLDFVLDRERESVWAKHTVRLGLDVHTIQQALALTTLTGHIADEREAVFVLASAPLLDGKDAETLDTLARCLHEIYPPRPANDGTSGAFLEPLQPDVLGEQLVARALDRHPTLLAAALDDVGGAATAAALTVLTRLAQRDMTQKVWLERAFQGRFSQVALAGLFLVAAAGAPIATIFEEAVERDLDAETAARLVGFLPRQSVMLLSPSIRIRQEHLKAIQASPDPKSIDVLNDIAAHSNDLSNALSTAGAHEEATAEALRSEEISRELAELMPDSHRPYHAMSLVTLANCLGEEGLREEALEAADEAVVIFRDVVAACPDAFQTEMAMALSTLANRLGDLERKEEALFSARDALRIWCKLAATQPGTLRPEYAAGLHNLAKFYGDLGRHTVARAAANKAAVIRRQLAAAQPDAYLPDLALTLNNLATYLSALGRLDEAVSAAEEAVVIFNNLAVVRSDAFGASLAISLWTLSSRYQEVKRLTDACQAVNDAIATLTPLFRRLPPAYSKPISMMVRHYVKVCKQCSQEPDEALLGPVAEVFQTMQAEHGVNPPPDR